jgi:hypothetical protein
MRPFPRLLLLFFALSLFLATSLIAGVISSRTYATSFPLTESALHENVHWANGGNTGINWTNVSTSPGRAIGHDGYVPYSDATAILQNNLTWDADQSGTGTVFQIAGSANPACYQEVEIRLRAKIAAYSITGYEINYKATQGSDAYMQIVRWNGPLGNFTTLKDVRGSQYGVKDGDVVSASIVGNVIKAYKNGVLLAQASDSTFASGSPGIGFNLYPVPADCANTNGNYGFSKYTAVSSRNWF